MEIKPTPKLQPSFFNARCLAVTAVLLGLCAPAFAQVVWTNVSSSQTWLTAANWLPNAVPTSTQDAQFGANPTSGTTGIGITMSTAGGLQRVGAIEVTSARSNVNLPIGNSSTTTAGVLELDGATVNGIANTILRNAGAGTTTLILTNTQGSGTQAMGVSNNLANGLIDCSSPITIYSIMTGRGYTKIGAGTLTLTASNLYSGSTIISNGIFALNDGTYLNNSTLVLAGGILLRNSQGITINRGTAYKSPLVVSNNSTIETTTLTSCYVHFDAPFTGTAGTTLTITNAATGGTNRFRLYAGGISYAGNILLATNGTVSGTNYNTVQLDLYNTNAASGADQTFSGVISGGGLVYKNYEAGGLLGGGNTIFTANNTYTGGTQIRGGFFGLGTDNALGFGNVIIGYDSFPIGLYASGAARLLTNDITVDTTLVNSTNLQIKGSQNLTLAGRLLIHTNLTQLTISNTATTTISGIITNAGITSAGIIKTGPGILVLSGANTFNGSVIVGGGTLALTGGGSVNNATNLTVVGGATLDLSGLSSTLALSSAQTFGGNSTNGATGKIILSGTAGLTLGSNSPLALGYANGTPALAVTNGTLTLASGTVAATVTVANGGAGLPAGVYKLIATNTAGFVSGTAPSSVTVTGDGLAGSSPSLVISNSELYLFVAPSATPPATPVANAASSTNITGFTASWNSASGASGYALDVSTVNNFSSCVSGYSNLLVGAVTSYAVTGLTPSTIYYYQVRATNAVSPSGNSATIAVTTLVAPFVWNAGSGNWSAAGSWQYANVPGNGAATGFTGAGGGSANDLTGLLLDSITFSNSAGAYLISGNALVVSNGIVNNSAASETISAPLTLGVAETFGAISGPLTFSGPITNAGNTLTVNATANVTNSGVISGAGALVKTGAGTLLLSAANTFTGATTNNAGTLQLSGGAALAASAVTLANVAGVTLGLSDNESIASLAGGGATGGTVALGANNLYVTSGTTTNSGSITGTGKLIKTGTGTLSLANASAIGPSFTLRVEGGTADLNRGGNSLLGILGSGNVIELAGGTLQLSASVQANFGFTAQEIDIYSNSTIFFNRPGSGSSTSPTNSSPLNFKNSATLSFGYSAAVTGGTTLFDAAAHTLQGNATLALGSYGITIQNPIGESGGSFGLTKTGVGQLNLNGINTYSGPTTNLQGTIAVNGTSTLGNGTGTLVFAGGNLLDANTRYGVPIANPIQLIYSGTNTIYGNSTAGASRYFPLTGALSGSVGTLEIRNEGSVVAGTFIVNLAAAGFTFSQPIIVGDAADIAGETSVLSFNNDNTGVQEFDGIISGTGSVVRGIAYDGGTAGITILTGANTYSGGTTISGGWLLANNTNGSATGTNTVFVTSGGTLGGTGMILGAVTNSFGSTLKPGLGGLDTSTLTISNNLGLAGNALFTLNRTNAPNAAKVSGLATVTYGGTLTLTNAGPALQAGDTFTLFSATNYAGSFTNIVLPALGANLAWATNLSAGSLAVVATTAPTTLALASSENPSGYLDLLTFTANVQTNAVTNAVTAGNATGSVIFSAAGTPFSTNSVSGSATSAAIGSLPRGTSTITAVYSGDANYLASTNTLNQVVTNHPPVAGNPSYTLFAGVTTLHIGISNLLAGVTDADGDVISLAGFSVSTNGVTLVSSGGSLNYYNPSPVADKFNYTVSDGFGGTNTGTVSIVINTGTVFGQTTPAINTAGGSATLTFAGIPGFSYSVARSTDLSTWTVILTTNAPGGGVFNFTDSSAPQPTAFYRLQYNP